jgi:hypothetical protein
MKCLGNGPYATRPGGYGMIGGLVPKVFFIGIAAVPLEKR